MPDCVPVCLQTWIDWVTDYIMLLLSSLSAWAAARSGAQNKDGSSHKSEEDGSAQQAQGSEQQHQATLALAATAAVGLLPCMPLEQLDSDLIYYTGTRREPALDCCALRADDSAGVCPGSDRSCIRCTFHVMHAPSALLILVSPAPTAYTA
jgi:hypothetical protein